jgi:hypothetical protein
MQLSGEGKTGILLALIGLGGAGAIVVAPAHTEIGWLLIAISVIGGVMLSSHHFRGMLPRVWTAAWPLTAGAQQGDRVHRIVVLTSAPERAPEIQAAMPLFCADDEERHKNCRHDRQQRRAGRGLLSGHVQLSSLVASSIVHGSDVQCFRAISVASNDGIV